MPKLPTTGKRHESGYAILMVFMLAAAIAISFYAVAPRVAFESQRDKEQILVDRGEQYKRAIQLYYRKFRKYPVKMEDLENTQNIRFLRKRYTDPMTGKAEWRLIHVGPGGQFTDSLTQKNSNTTKKDTSSANTFIAEFKSVADPTDAVDQVTPALRRRPSDQAGAPGSFGGDGSGVAQPVDPNNPNTDPSLNAGVFPAGGAIASPVGGAFPGDGTGTPNPTGYVPGGEMPIGMQQQLQQQMQQNGQAPQALVMGGGATVAGGSTASGPAAIQQLLTSPRPGGPPPGIYNPSGRPMNDYGFVDPNSGNNIPSPSNPQPVQLSGSSNAVGSNTFGNGPSNNGATFSGASASAGLGQTTGQSAGGNFATGSFAGVASTLERRGIKKYADFSKYNEWEFIYDYSKDVAKASGLAVNTNGANTNSPTVNPANPFGAPVNGASGTSGSTNSGGSTVQGNPNLIPPNPNATSN